MEIGNTRRSPKPGGKRFLGMWKTITEFVFGPPINHRLPERVRAAIALQQDQAEILIGWVQLLLVVFFFALYTIAPKTSEGTVFTPVPYALAAYFSFTVVRLLLAYRSILPGWFLLGSVIIDMGLLMVLIWSFHHQYEQPAPFYLKAPTLLYVFIFVSLRTLRFEPTYVIAAGIAASVGWMALVWYAIDEMVISGAVVTRDYVQYLTSNRVLIGAEIDKVLSILLVTTVLAVALIRARRLLIHSIADAEAARDLSRFVSPEIADHITTADQAIEPGYGEVKLASVLFCDIEGFASISERLSPAELIQTLNDYFAAVSEVISRHGGVITQFEGDAMLVTFNTAKPDPHHAANALGTAIGIQEVVRSRRFGYGIEMRTRCGVNTGELVAGAVGTRERLLFTVHGDEVNIAARLEQLNKDYGAYILATEQTVAAAGAEFARDPIGVVPVRGRAAPVAVYSLDAAAVVSSA